MNPKIYLDNCCFNRPFDDQDSLVVRLETEAKLHVQQMVKDGKLMLCWSYVLDYENSLNPFRERRTEIQRWKALATECALETPEVLALSKSALAQGIKPFDALHLACAQTMKCDIFLTVDKGILRKSPGIDGIKIVSPIDFVIEKEGA
jgi:predicted nucleic acid-binding protein